MRVQRLRGRNAGVVGTGMYVPERRLTNFDLERMVETSDEWIRTRTGIVERRICAEGEAASDLGALAAREALRNAGVSPQEVDLILVATVTPDMYFPSTACLIQAKLGASRAAAFDMNAACSGFIYALATAAQFVTLGTYETVLVVGTECLSRFTDWSDRNTCVLFGDGAGAAVVQPVETGYGVLGFELGADGTGGHLLHIPAGGSAMPITEEAVRQKLHCIKMNGNEVFRFAVRIQAEVCEHLLHRLGLRGEDVDLFIPHQANIRIIQAAAERLGIPNERLFLNVDRYGNTSAASIPIALHEARQGGRLKQGHRVLLVGFGGGLTWGAMLLRWALPD